MKNYYLIVANLLVFLLFSSCSVTDDEIINEERQDVIIISNNNEEQDNSSTPVLEALELFDMPYGDHPKQVFDIYLPNGRSSASTKAVILIHGGGWRGGDKSNMEEDIHFFRTVHPDYAIFNFNYVLAVASEHKAFPNQYLDIQLAIEKITAYSEFFQVKPEFALLGRSAGAHLAMMYDSVYDTLDQVKFVANIVGPSDLTDPYYLQDPDFDEVYEILIDESQFPENSDPLALNSPALVANEDTSPILSFYGNQDPLVPITNAHTLDQALLEVSNEYILNIYDGGHGNNWSDFDQQDLRNQIDLYLNDFLPIE